MTVKQVNINAVVSWSGGKDSYMALQRLWDNPQVRVYGLLTSVSRQYDRVSIHGVRKALLMKQAEALHLPLTIQLMPEMPNMEVYELAMLKQFAALKEEGVTHIAFGDIFLEDIRAYRQRLVEQAGLQAIFPLWGMEPQTLITSFIASGCKAIIVATNEAMKNFCGKMIDQDLLNQLPPDIDMCGENGEFHTFVIEAPLFSNSLIFKTGRLLFRPFDHSKNSDAGGVNLPKGNWYIDLIPNS